VYVKFGCFVLDATFEAASLGVADEVSASQQLQQGCFCLDFLWLAEFLLSQLCDKLLHHSKKYGDYIKHPFICVCIFLQFFAVRPPKTEFRMVHCFCLIPFCVCGGQELFRAGFVQIG
jgi:hypothetical protein